MNSTNVRELQAPLAELYRRNSDAAQVVDTAATAGTDITDPFHFNVSPMTNSGVNILVGVHAALGGPHDAPTPGDVLCAALAACQESSIRMIANSLSVKLEHLDVKVAAKADVRGTMMIDPTVPVGFQGIDVTVNLRVTEGTPKRLSDTLCRYAEACCVVLQTLRSPPRVGVTFITDDLNRAA